MCFLVYADSCHFHSEDEKTKIFFIALCYWPDACVSPKFLCRSPNHQCDEIWKWGLWGVMKFTWSHKGGVPMTCGICVLYKKTKQKETRALSFPVMWGPGETVAVGKPGRTLSRKWICQHLHLGLPASTTVRSKCLSQATLSMIFCCSSLDWFIHL